MKIFDNLKIFQAEETSRVCTFPSVACYEGSVLESALGNRYLSFQGIRSAERGPELTTRGPRFI